MFYVADENERHCTKKEIISLVVAFILWFVFMFFMLKYSPPVDPPQSMRKNYDPYWYSGE